MARPSFKPSYIVFRLLGLPNTPGPGVCLVLIRNLPLGSYRALSRYISGVPTAIVFCSCRVNNTLASLRLMNGRVGKAACPAALWLQFVVSVPRVADTRGIPRSWSMIALVAVA